VSNPQEDTGTAGDDLTTFALPPWKEGVHKYLEQKREEEKRLDQERKEGRKVGKLSKSLREKLRNCNPLQLRNVKKLCDQYLADHRMPPLEWECRKRAQRALCSCQMKNKRYQLELRKCGKKCGGCPHGPYLHVYHRDGSIIRDKHIKERDYRHLPRRIRGEVLAYLRRYREKGG
jgi:hypothetical protein